MVTKKKFVLGMDAKTYYSTTLCPENVISGEGTMTVPETELSNMTSGTLTLEAGEAGMSPHACA